MAENQPSNSSIKLSITGIVASWCARHRWPVLTLSVVVILLAILSMSTLETKTLEDDNPDVTESGRAASISDERFRVQGVPDQAPRRGPTELVIFSNPSLRVDDPGFLSMVERVTEPLAALPEVASLESYYDANNPDLVSDDGHAVLAVVEITPGGFVSRKINTVMDAVRSVDKETDDFQIAMTGNIGRQQDELLEEDFARILLVSLGLGMVILVIAFRSLVAAAVPLILAIWAIVSALGVATLVSQQYALVDVYAEIVLLMGLAVGIDYSLFILSRFRFERVSGRPKLEAISVASNTTGRAVVYAGITVVLPLGGLMLTNLDIFISLSLAAIIVVLIAVIGSLTLLPALLSILGDNINKLPIPFLGRGDDRGGVWGTIAAAVLNRPAIFASATVLLLVGLALPTASLNLGFNSGADSLHDAVEGKRALVLLEEHFTSGFTAQASVVVDAPDVHTPDIEASIAALLERLDEEKAFFGPFRTIVNPAGDLLIIRVPLDGKIDDKESEDAVKLLREDIIPDIFNTAAITQIYVGGDTAEGIDFRRYMYSRAPYIFGFVLGLSLILLLVMFRSIVIPIKAIVLNLLSVAAAYGVLVMVFQWGWGIGLLGSEATGVIEAWLPLFLFAILFGLSMDYHMLLLSRIKEAHDRGAPNEESVLIGIQSTAGQITSAAAIMVVVFTAFALGRIIGLQQFGVGLGVAVLIDATVIRSVLLPATMKLLGNRNWYFPKWLEWLPKLGQVEAGRGTV